MAADRITIYAGGPIAEVLGDRSNKSGRLGRVCGRYLELVTHCTPTLTLEEWCAVCDALHDTWRQDGAWRFVDREIADAARLRDLATKYVIDAESLVARVKAWSPAERVAVVEIVERFWENDTMPLRGARGFDDEALVAAGARIATEEKTTT
jgi:hypothetical protein